jgi:inhibitor of KinA sporulation pathway (predicted exonuclease)/predicted RNA-binding Zn-ribbon protein involved in translation (DUF1610 family)
VSFVVFDLEWNSAAPGKAGASENLPELPFEIIEIGAVKLSAAIEPLTTFTAKVRPQVYKKLNKYIARVTQLSQESLSQGDPFPLALSKFVDFCGEDVILASWGLSDPQVLKQNMDFYSLDTSFFNKALNLQVFFANMAEGGQNSQQRSIEYALEFLNIETELSFHDALNDARYAGRILNALLLKKGTEEGKETLRPYLYDPFLQREKSWQTAVTAGRNAEATIREQEFTCPACQSLLTTNESIISNKKQRRWSWVLNCEKHGSLRCAINRRRHEGKDIYYFKLSLPYPPKGY